MVYTQTHTYPISISHKDGIMSFTGKWIKLQIMLNEKSQAQKAKCHMFSLICGS
jgi:hypothetical protein